MWISLCASGTQAGDGLSVIPLSQQQQVARCQCRLAELAEPHPIARLLQIQSPLQHQPQLQRTPEQAANTDPELLNTLLLESAHRSIGASTAVFAALGLTAGFVWHAKLMAQDRWPYRLGPIVGGLALLMFTGTGDENTDIGAHLMGFVCGFGGGILLTRYRDRLQDRNLQRLAGIAAIATVLLAWITAFGG